MTSISLIFWRLDWWAISETNNIQLKKNYIGSSRGQRLVSELSSSKEWKQIVSVKQW